MIFSNQHDFFSFFLDENQTVSTRLLASKNWSAVPVPNHLTLIESEWLADGIALFGNRYLSYTFEYKGKVSSCLTDNTPDNLLDTHFKHTAEFIILTNEHLDFVYFKNQNNLYHLFCGTPDFVAACVRCSLKMAKRIFFEYGVNDFDPLQDEYHYLIGIWDLYQPK